MESIFGKGNYFVEIMDHDLGDEKRVIPLLVQVSRETGIPLLATNDSPLTSAGRTQMRRRFSCASQTGKTLDDTNRMRMETRELWRQERGMRCAGSSPEYADAIERTEEVAKRCHVDFRLWRNQAPPLPTEAGETSEQMFRRLCEKGSGRGYQPVTQEARDRMEYEIGVISKMGYVDYFLIVWISSTTPAVMGSSSGRGAARRRLHRRLLHVYHPASIRCATACCSSAFSTRSASPCRISTWISATSAVRRSSTMSPAATARITSARSSPER